MNWDIIQTLLRSLLKAGAGALIARGLLQSDEVEPLIGAVLLIGGVVWGVFHRTGKGPGPSGAVTLLFLGLAPALLSGCASYTHQRPIFSPVSVGTNAPAIVGYEKTGFHSFLMVGQASKIHTLTKDGSYSRTLSVGSIQGQGDTDMVKSLVEAGATAAATGAKVMAKP